MTIHVSKDAESAINAAVQRGLFASADEMIEKLVREFAATAQARTTVAPESADHWAHRLQAWVNAHPPRALTIDDSRESIYSGRGE